MSRLVIKNLPNGITETRLRTLFAEKGVVTDINLKYSKDGVFRKLAFIGFLTENDAQSAKDYFHQTYIDTAKIQVEYFRSADDPEKPRPWSQHSADSSRFQKRENLGKPPKNLFEKPPTKTPVPDDKFSQILRNPLLTVEEKEKLERIKDNPEFLEFLEVQRNNSMKNLWNNDTATVSSKTTEAGKVGEVVEDVGEAVEEKEGKVDFNKMKNAVKMKHLPKGVKKVDIRDFFKPLMPLRVHLPKKAKDIAFVQFNNPAEVSKAVEYDNKLLSEKSVHVVKCLDSDATGLADAEKASTNVVPDYEVVGEHGRLFIRGLFYGCVSDDLETLFGKFGPITEVLLPMDYFTRKNKGYAIITFMMPEHAVKALNALNGKAFQGRTLQISPAQPKPEDETPKKNDSGSTFKKEKDSKQKETSQKPHNWNSLFLGTNAVIDVMSKRYNVSKSQILDGDSSKQSAAVRLALGETQIVNETREFLVAEGVKLDAFSQLNATRSKTVILVKNLPAATPSSELLKLFRDQGSVMRMIFPPSGISALVEMTDAADAKKAFRNLAYSKQFGSLPLYLEWAPVDALSGPAVAPPPPDTKPLAIPANKLSTAAVPAAPIEEVVADQAEDEEDTGEALPGSTLFVKNLNWITKEETLKAFFSTVGPLRSVVIARKPDPKVPGGLLSMGYGFVEFRKPQHAKEALKEIQSKEVDGHRLELKMSERTMREAPQSTRKVTTPGKQTSAKIMVRNIAFEVSEKEIRDLFKVFGDLKSVRLPKKMGGSGSHRGFCFVEFHRKADAKKAFDALCHSTHLYDRRLVLEWAESDDQDVNDLRQKVSRHFHEDESSRKKLKKRNLYDELDQNNATAVEDE